MNPEREVVGAKMTDIKPAADIEAHYNRLHDTGHEYLDADGVMRNLDGPWHRTLHRYLKDIAGKTVLEVACGQGPNSLWMNRQGAKVWSVDFAQEAVDHTRRLIVREFPEAESRILKGDMQQLPFEDSRFDVVVSCETLEHLPDYKAGLREVFRVLKPGGRFYLTTENYLNCTGVFRLFDEKIRKRQWKSGSFIQPIEQFFIAPQLLGDMKKTGFRIQKTDSCGYYLYFPRQPLPLDLVFLAIPGPHRSVFKYFGRHLFVLSEKPQ